MAKRELDADLLTGGSLDKGKDKEAKKAEKKQAKLAKAKEKNEKKRSALKTEIDELKKAKAEETDEAKLAEIDKKIKKLSEKYSGIGSSASIAPRTKRIIKSTVAVVVVVALLVTYIATGTVRKGFFASLSFPAQHFTGMTVSNGENKARIKVSTYNFYFATTYNNLQSQKAQYEQYGIDPEQAGLNVDFDKPLSRQTYTDPETNEKMTWAEHIEDIVLDAIESTYTYYLAAVEANNGEEPEITDEQKSQINESVEQYRTSANQYGYTVSGYLVRAMGHGVTESVLRTETTRQFIASNYESSISTENSAKEYSADELNNYRAENKSKLETVDIKIFECTNEDDAKAFEKALKADGSNFADLASQYAASDFYKTAYKEDDGYSTELGVTRKNLQDKNYAIATADEHTHEEGEEHSDDEEPVYSGLDWIFSADRKAGDIKQYSTSVVYVISPVSITDKKTINVRHILIAPETDSEDESSSRSATEATTEQWNAAYNKAKGILDEFNKGDKSEESFAALVSDNTTDTGSAQNGGLYENVITGQMVNSFSYWCFTDGRKAGDTAIVKSDFGYHIMYFVGANDQSIWEYSAQQALAEDDSKSETEKLEKDYNLKVNWFGSRYFEKDTDIDN